MIEFDAHNDSYEVTFKGDAEAICYTQEGAYFSNEFWHPEDIIHIFPDGVDREHLKDVHTQLKKGT